MRKDGETWYDIKGNLRTKWDKEYIKLFAVEMKRISDGEKLLFITLAKIVREKLSEENKDSGTLIWEKLDDNLKNIPLIHPAYVGSDRTDWFERDKKVELFRKYFDWLIHIKFNFNIDYSELPSIELD